MGNVVVERGVFPEEDRSTYCEEHTTRRQYLRYVPFGYDTREQVSARETCHLHYLTHWVPVSLGGAINGSLCCATIPPVVPR